MLALIALVVPALAHAAPAPQDVTPTSTFLPEGPTTVVYTWTHPYTQTKTVTYGGPGWTTYLDYTTVDGTRLIQTVVAPTRTASSAPAAEEEGSSCVWVFIVAVIVAMLALGGLGVWLLIRRRKQRAVAATVPVVKKSPSIASSDASSTYSKEAA